VAAAGVTPARGAERDNGPALVLAFAAAKLLFHVLTNGHYGFHRDELQTLADARHLDWGFVAYPPLTPLLGRLELLLFGTSLSGFRLLAAAAQSAVVVLAGALARRFGGRAWAQLVAAVAVAIAPIALSASSVFQYVSFDALFFVLMAYFLVRLQDSGDGRFWLAIGAALGLGAETKYAVVFYAAGLVAAILATPLRRQIATRWPWLGAGVALLIALPNLVWQASHDFISLDFLRAIHERDIRWGRTDGFAVRQLYVATNAVSVPLWLLGLLVLLFSARWRRHRPLGVMAVAIFLLFALAQGRGYYMGPVYPMLLAAGAAELERLAEGWAGLRRRLTRLATPSLLALGGCAMAAVVLPLASPGSPYFDWQVRRNGDLAEEVGWPELAREVARIYAALPADEKAKTGVFCGNYGEAGAIDLYGPALGLPPAISTKNSFWLRGPGDLEPQTLIVLGVKREDLEGACGSVELAGQQSNPWQVKNEETTSWPSIFICRSLRQPLKVRWPLLRSFG
jgi:MFS family permease